MKSLPLRARLHIAVMVTAAAAIVSTIAELPQPTELPIFVALAVATVVSSMLKLRLPTLKNRATMSVSFVIDFAALLVLGPSKAMLVAGIGAISQSTIRVTHRNPPHRILFNVACLVVTMQASGAVYGLLGGRHAPLVWPHDATPIAGAVIVYFLLNTAAIAVAVAL